MKRRFRAYKLAPGTWGFGFGSSPSGPYLEFAKWVLCYDYLYDD